MWGKTTKKKTHFTKKNWTQARKFLWNQTEPKNIFLLAPLLQIYGSKISDQVQRSWTHSTAHQSPEQASSFFNHHQTINISQGTPCFVNYNSFGNCYVRLSPNIFQKLWVSWPDVLLLDKINFLSASANFSFHLGQMVLISVVTIDMSTVPV